MTATFFEALKTQKRVVWALMLRETKTLFGKHKLGYLWAVINGAFQIGVFWAIREVGGFQPPHGMSTPAFLLGGFVPFFIFREAVNGGLNAVGGNKALLGYPQVFPLDILVARTLLQGAMQTVVFVLLFLLALGMGQQMTIVNIASILTAFSAALLLGFGTGALCSALNLMWVVTGQLVPMILRVLFFTSGLFFAVVDLPSRARDILFYNPLSHIIVISRGAFVPDYGARFISLPYLFGFILVMLAAGLLLERYSRHYLDRAL